MKSGGKSERRNCYWKTKIVSFDHFSRPDVLIIQITQPSNHYSPFSFIRGLAKEVVVKSGNAVKKWSLEDEDDEDDLVTVES